MTVVDGDASEDGPDDQGRGGGTLRWSDPDRQPMVRSRPAGRVPVGKSDGGLEAFIWCVWVFYIYCTVSKIRWGLGGMRQEGENRRPAAKQDHHDKS